MAATKRNFNWTTVSFNAVSITGVQSVEVDPNAQLAKFSGDADIGPTTIILEAIDNLVTIVAADLIAIRSIAPGTRGALAATHKDAKAAVGGALVYAISSTQGIAASNSVGGPHKGFGSGRLLVHAEWADSTTNPLTSSTS